MPYTLRIIFEGLILFVPEGSSFDQPQAISAVAALLPNLARPRPINQPKNGLQDLLLLDPHFPLLQVAEKYRRKGSTREAHMLINPGDPAASLLYGFHSTDLEVRPEDRDQRHDLTVANGIPGSDVANGAREPDPQKGETGWFHWVGNLEAAASAFGKVPARFHPDRPLKDKNPDVTARLKITEGTLSSSTLQKPFFDFLPHGGNGKSGSHFQWLTKRVEWTISGLQQDSKIVFKAFAGTNWLENGILVLGPPLLGASSIPEEVVEVNLYSREIDSFVGLLDATPKTDDPEFLVLYELTKPAGPHQDVLSLPFPHARNGSFTKIGNRAGGCSPARAAGFLQDLTPEGAVEQEVAKAL